MLIGCIKETKSGENRVGLIPDAVRKLIENDHKVWVEKDAGAEAGFTDQNYINAGAKIISNVDCIWHEAEIIIKVKEPTKKECKKIRKDQILFSFLSLGADPELAVKLKETGVYAFAYESITDDSNRLPILAPMSVIGGNLTIQYSMKFLNKDVESFKDHVKFLQRNDGLESTNVLIFGSGNTGQSAARLAKQKGANVTVISNSPNELDILSKDGIDVIFYDIKEENKISIQEKITDNLNNLQPNLVIGMLRADKGVVPIVITKEMLKNLPKGAVIIDMAIDQGGCFETSRLTNHDNPSYITNGIIRSCIKNLPGIVPEFASKAISNSTLPFILNVANNGLSMAIRDKNLANGLAIGIVATGENTELESCSAMKNSGLIASVWMGYC